MQVLALQNEGYCSFVVFHNPLLLFICGKFCAYISLNNHLFSERINFFIIIFQDIF